MKEVWRINPGTHGPTSLFVEWDHDDNTSIQITVLSQSSGSGIGVVLLQSEAVQLMARVADILNTTDLPQLEQP